MFFFTDLLCIFEIQLKHVILQGFFAVYFWRSS